MQQEKLDYDKYLNLYPKLFVFIFSVIASGLSILLLSLSGWSIPLTIYILVGIFAYQLAGIHAGNGYLLVIITGILKATLEAAEEYLQKDKKK